MTRWHQYLRLTWRGIIFGALFGCIPALLGGWALVTGRVSFQVRVGERFVATPDSSPVGYWTFVVLLCLAAVLVWAKTIADLVTLIRSRRSRLSDGGVSHVA